MRDRESLPAWNTAALTALGAGVAALLILPFSFEAGMITLFITAPIGAVALTRLFRQGRSADYFNVFAAGSAALSLNFVFNVLFALLVGWMYGVIPSERLFNASAVVIMSLTVRQVYKTFFPYEVKDQ